MSSGQLAIQPRDLQILTGLFESRVMTRAHIATLYFKGSQEAAKKRVQKLIAAKLINERPRKRYEASVLFLARAGYRLLDERGILKNYPSTTADAFARRAQVSDLTLKHELEVMSVRAAIQGAIDVLPNFTVAEFSTWPKLCQFDASPRWNGRRHRMTVRPDGFIRIHETEKDGSKFEHLFFLEVDRSTEPQDTLIKRAVAYRDYYASGGMAKRFGESPESYKQFPFRVLYVLPTEARRDNTIERLLQVDPPILTQVWLSTFCAATISPLGAVWKQPRDQQGLAVRLLDGDKLTFRTGSSSYTTDDSSKT